MLANFSLEAIPYSPDASPDSQHNQVNPETDFDSQVLDFHKKRQANKIDMNKSLNKSMNKSLNKSSRKSLNQSRIKIDQRGGVNNSIVMISYTVYWISKREGNKQYKTDIELSHLATVKQAIEEITTLLSKILADQGSRFALTVDHSIYELYKAKKDGERKPGYPALDYSQVLTQTGLENLFLFETSPRAVVMRGAGKLGSKMTKDHSQDSMVSQSMPGSKSLASTKSLQTKKSLATLLSMSGEDYVEDTLCFCIPIKRKVDKNDPRGAHNINSVLIDKTDLRL